MSRTCVRCKQTIGAERLEVLPDTHTCGAMIFDHKTAGRLEFVRPENAQAVETLKRFVKRARN